MLSDSEFSQVFKVVSKRWGEDATQEAIEQVLKFKSRPDTFEDFRNLVSHLAKLKFLTRERLTKREGPGDTGEFHLVERGAQLDKLIAREDLETLDPVFLGHGLGYKLQELAHELGIATGTVKSRRHRRKTCV